MAQKSSASKKTKKETPRSGMGRREMQDTSRRIMAVALSALALAVMAAVLVFVISWGYRFGCDLFTDRAAGTDRTVVLVKIDAEDSARTVAAELQERGLINDRVLFVVKGKLYSYAPKPGAYQLNAAMTDRQIWQAISGQQTGSRGQ